MLRTALESEGYDIEEAADGQEALSLIHQRTPDLMVLDLNMPKLDGMAVLEQLKPMAPSLKPRVIVLTAHGSIPTAVKATRLGAVDFLEKPVMPSELREVVRSVLHDSDLESPAVVSDAPNQYHDVLERIRRRLRLGDFTTAETMLMKAADRNAHTSVEYFNLLGVLYEAQRNWRLARKCYGKAIAADKKYEPAQLNMRRLYELLTYGRSEQEVVLGDES
jgi:DNA-binding response OmpR family regulator